jgi:hypothetical protein
MISLAQENAVRPQTGPGVLGRKRIFSVENNLGYDLIYEVKH